jgi:hypothetical protein
MLKFPYLPLPYYFISILAFAIHGYFRKLEAEGRTKKEEGRRRS